MTYGSILLFFNEFNGFFNDLNKCIDVKIIAMITTLLFIEFLSTLVLKLKTKFMLLSIGIVF